MSNKDKMAEAAFMLSLKYGFDNVTIKQIQNEAKVTAGAIYYHFKDKNDILAYMIELYLKTEIDEYDKILRNNEGTLEEKLKFVFYYHIGKDYKTGYSNISINNTKKNIDYKEYYLFLLGIYHQHPELREFFHDINDRMLTFYKELVEESMENGEIRQDLDSGEIALYIFTIFKGFIEVWTGFPKIPLEDIINTNVKMICNNIKK